jgi:hypothetical protein
MRGKGHDAYLESLVLQHPLDGRIFTIGRDLGLKDDAKGAIAYNLALGILHLARLAGDAILDLLADDFCRQAGWLVEGWTSWEDKAERWWWVWN